MIKKIINILGIVIVIVWSPSAAITAYSQNEPPATEQPAGEQVNLDQENQNAKEANMKEAGAKEAKEPPAKQSETPEQKENDSLRRQMIPLKQVKANLDAEVKELQESNGKLEKKLKEVSDELQKSERSAKESSDKSEDQRLRELKLQKENDDLNKRNETFINNLKDANSQTEKKVKEVSDKLQNSEQSAKALNNKLADQMHRYILLQRDKDQLSQKNNASLEEFTLLKQKNRNLETDLKNLKASYDHLLGQSKKVSRMLSIKNREADLLKTNMNDLNETLKKLDKERVDLKEQNEVLRELNPALERLKKETAEAYSDLGAAYSQLKIFDLAIDAYKKSLKYGPKNAKAHYNLGLLYQHSDRDIEKSIDHFKQYLKLDPRAKDKEEVECLIKLLEEGNKPSYEY